jgi:hypothetical protein
MQIPVGPGIWHLFPGLQSASVWHGAAHFPNAVLQRCVTQFASLVHGRASGPGVESCPGAAGAGAAVVVGAGATGGVVGAGVGAGAGWP